MKRNKSIQLKAAFLLMVFSLNTIVGLACSIGIDMGFNTKHHHEEATEASVHVHADGKKHMHPKEASTHHHDEAINDHHKSKDEKDNCCNDGVMKITQLDKTVPQGVNVVLNPIFFTAFISSFYHIDVLYPSSETVSIKHFVRSYHPPIPDIRIGIQSFQI
jgi:hypothetical protein